MAMKFPRRGFAAEWKTETARAQRYGLGSTITRGARVSFDGDNLHLVGTASALMKAAGACSGRPTARVALADTIGGEDLMRKGRAADLRRQERAHRHGSAYVAFLEGF
jgi:hypothetical protein